MTSNTTTTFGTVVGFTAAEGVDLEMKSSRPSKDDCLAIGYQFFQVAHSEKEMDALIDEHDAVLIRRALKVFANYAARTKQPAVAKFVRELRDGIVVVYGDQDAA